MCNFFFEFLGIITNLIVISFSHKILQSFRGKIDVRTFYAPIWQNYLKRFFPVRMDMICKARRHDMLSLMHKCMVLLMTDDVKIPFACLCTNSF